MQASSDLGFGNVFGGISEKASGAAEGVANTGRIIGGGIAALFSGNIETTWKPSKPDELPVYEEGKHWDVSPDAELTPKVAKSGVASIPPMTVVEIFKKAVAKTGGTVALRQEAGEGQWREFTWQQYYDETVRFAKSLIKIGFQQHEAVNIIGFNSPEWFFANNGAIFAGGKAAGIYTTNGPDACAYITDHSEARVVVVENEAQLAKFKAVWSKLPRLKAVVVYRPEGPVDEETPHGPVHSWDAFLKLGEDVPQADLDARAAAQKPGHCCLLIYTSGTTGPPKAVMISHDNILFTANSMLERLGESFCVSEEVTVSYLPLSHIAAQLADIWAPVCGAAFRPGTCSVWFARPDALKGTLGMTLKAARPTWFFGVPRVWEKIMEGMKKLGAESTGAKLAITKWAKEQGAAYWENQQVGHSGHLPVGYLAAKALVFSKVREALGLDRCKVQYTGAAPMAREVFLFFASLDIPVFELYGMSECTGPQTVTHKGGYLLGSTGQNLSGTEIRIDHVAGRDKEGEGEICYRGRHVMMGYMKQPEKTQETIDPQGYLHSGDVGRVDANGFLFITGRIKELIITAGGENIAPVPIEDDIKARCPFLSNVMLVGDRQKYNVCLVTLKAEVDPGTGRSTEALAMEALKVVEGITTVPAAIASPEYRKKIEEGIAAYNKNAVSQAQKVQKFEILEQDFAIPDELTPTMKLKRDVTAEKYKDVIAKLYAE